MFLHHKIARKGQDMVDSPQRSGPESAAEEEIVAEYRYSIVLVIFLVPASTLHLINV